MKRFLTEGRASSQLWIVLGVVLLVVAGLLLATALLELGPAAPASSDNSGLSSTATSAPTTPASHTPAADPPGTATSEPRPTAKPLVATVNGYTITRSYFSQTVALNKVLGEISGASTLGEEETLQRLITSQLVLQGVTTIDEPTEEEVEGLIAGLEQNWQVSDEMVVGRLKEVGIERAFMVDSIKRLLAVEAGLQSLHDEGRDLSEWLSKQREDAQIVVFEGVVSAERPEASQTAQPEPHTATPRPEVEVPEFAPDFTLSRAGGGSFTLGDQLEQGPVVLVFFERCG